MIVSGLRGVGKTVLLLEFEGIAKDAGWTAPRPCEIKSDTDFRSQLADAAYQALLQLSARKAIGERLRSFTGLLRGFKVGAIIRRQRGVLVRSRRDKRLHGQPRARPDQPVRGARPGGPRARYGRRVPDRRDAVPGTRGAGGRGSGNAPDVAEEAASGACRRGSSTAAGPDGHAKSYAERLFAYPKLGPLSEDAARQALVAPARARDVAWDDDALARIVGESGCYPAFIQAYGKEAWNHAPRSPIRVSDVQGAEATVLGEARRRVLPRAL